MKKLLRVIEIAAWAGLFAVAALLLGLRYWVLPDIERYRGDIVAAISRGVGLEVKVGGIEARWQGLRPQVHLSDVRIYDTQGREALALPSLENVLSWRSLLHGELRLHSLVVERPRLGVRRDAAGTLYVAGMKLSPGTGDGRFTDWLLGQEEILIRDAQIEWLDEKRGAPPLVLSELTLRLRNTGERHSIGLSARPPASLGSNLDLRAELLGETGRIYAELGYTDLAAWRAWLDYPLDLRRGQGALRLWASLQNGQFQQATADVAMTDVMAQLAPDVPPLELASVHGRLLARMRAGGYEFTGQQLALTAVRGERMQPTDIQVSWRPQAAAAEEHGVVSVKLLELAPLAQLAGSLPMSEPLRKLLTEAAPRGRLSEVSVEWHGPYAAPQRYRAQARFSDLAVRAWNDMGAAGLSGAVEATEAKGRLSIASRNAELELPRIFPEPRIALDSLSGEVEWERHGTALAVRLASAGFENRHLSGNASGSYSRAGVGPGRIDLSAHLTRFDGKHTARYLPGENIMGTARGWVAAAIVDGQGSNVQLRLRGDLRDFPFRDPEKGEFLVTARVEKGVLAYANGWPRIHDIDGQLRVERDALEITGRSAMVLGARLANVRVAIPQLANPDRRVLITGQATGPTSEFLKFIESSPVQRRTGGMTAAMRVSGNGRLGLKLELPLSDLARTQVAGAYEFAANTVTLHPRLPPLESAGGKISFTQAGFTLGDVHGQAFGGAVAIAGGSRPGEGIRVTANGDATVAALRPLLDHPLMAHLSGASSYAATLSLRDGLAHVSVETSLQGIASALPPPLEKAASDTLALRLDVIPFKSGAGDRVAITLGRLAAADLRRVRQGDSMVVQRAGIAFSPGERQRIRLPQRPGSLLYGSIPALDLDLWRPLLSGGGSGSGTEFDLRFGALDAFGKRLRNQTVRGTVDGAGWSATLGGEGLAGEMSFRHEGGGLLTARLAHFNVPPDIADAAAPSARRPADLPSLDLIAERLSFHGHQLGRVEVAGNRSGEDWHIEKLAFTNPDASFRAQGWWRAAAQSGSELDFELEVADAGRFLRRIGYPDLVKGGKVQLAGSLAWQGQPTSLDYPTLSGKLRLHARDGQFLEIEPGIGKLISLMSLQALPRRIALDFRDVFSKGFQFDRIDSSAELAQGVMTVKEFRMRGSAADVQMSGEVDIAKETQSMRVRVVPSLGDSASTAVAIVNPVAGVAAAIAQRVLKNPLGQIFAFEYSVTGSWSEPQVARISAPVASEVNPQ